MKAGGEVEGNEKIRAAAFLGDPVEDGGFGRPGRRDGAEAEQPVHDKSGCSGLEETLRFGGPNQRFFPDLGFDTWIGMSPFPGSPREQEFGFPAELPEFQSQEDGIIAVMARADEKEGVAGLGQMGKKFPQGAGDGLSHEILDPRSFAEAFFLPGAGLGR
jgi:hypothetical protein